MSQLFSVVYEDNHLIIVSKQSGVLSQGDETNDLALPDMVKDYLKNRYQKPGNVFCGLVHRLDRPVSGLVVLAKTSKALARMNDLFKERQVQKTYWAVVSQAPPNYSGRLEHWLLKNSTTNTVKAFYKEVKYAQYACLSYRRLASAKGFHLLEVNPVTGRPHQIRVQLASIGCSICGDAKYGSVVEAPRGSIYLHARAVAFSHPVKQEPLRVEAALPEAPLWDLFRNMPVF